MSPASIGLYCILKNEVKNIPRLLESVKDCFDEIYFTDTGSTDGSKELISEYISNHANPSNSKIHLYDFKWCDDFAKARNASLAPVTTDYAMWLDLDDVLSDAKAFIEWRNCVMQYADFWLATYHYALDDNGRPACSFARERIVKTNLKFQWKYFIHEGMMPQSPIKKDLTLQYASTWNVKHLRSADDLIQDRSRNLTIFEKHKDNLDSRMKYYYGKELFENQKPLEAFQQLDEAIKMPDLELHDRIMGMQYTASCAALLNQYEKAMSVAHQGLVLAPQRAEFFTLIGDCLLKQNRIADAAPYFEAATKCSYSGQNSIQGPIFQHEASYKTYPLNQLARIHANSGDVDRAHTYIEEAMRHNPTAETLGMHKELLMMKEKVGVAGKHRIKTKDVVISCPPQTLYEWDKGIYGIKGIGGSETAAVELSDWISKLTGRKVIIFNPRDKKDVFDGVEYAPGKELAEYFRDYSPSLHIAWRHSMTLSNDPMQVWCHDLGIPGMEHQNFETLLCLSEFHKKYVKNFFGIKEEKIWVTRNGIDPKRFTAKKPKDLGKIVWSSSPDRGLDRAIRVMDLVHKEIPEAKLHVYYGFENMLKMGLNAQVAGLIADMDARPYVKFHGNVTQAKLTEELSDACLWLYPTNFLETYCITAIEMLCSGVYPITRNWGGLEFTLKGKPGVLLDASGESDDDIKEYAKAVFEAHHLKKWEIMTENPEQFSWESVAKEWINKFNL